MTKQQRGRTSSVQTERILFEEHSDGLWWLEGNDLSEFKRLVGLRSEGQRVGFEPTAVYGYANELAQQGVTVVVMRDCGIYTVGTSNQVKPKQVKSSVLFLAPELLLDSVQLLRMERATPQSTAHLKEQAAADLGSVYVYQVYDQVYEIDWELTRVPRASLESKLFAAHKLGKKVACRVVAPKTQRNGRRRDVSGEDNATSTPNGKGQLRLVF